MPEYRQLSLTALQEPPLPIRAQLDEQKLNELADSIRRVGLLEPLIVYPNGALYEVAAGHRRQLAAQIAGLTEVPCAIYSEKELAREAAMLHENIYREDLSPAEEALFFQQLIEKYKPSEQQLVDMVRQPLTYIYSRLDLLKGDAEVFQALAEKKITLGVAQQLNRVNLHVALQVVKVGSEEEQAKLAHDAEVHRRYLLMQAVQGGASVRLVQSWVENWKLSLVPPGLAQPAPGNLPQGPPPEPSPRACFLCGKGHDPEHLLDFQVHWYHQDMLNKLKERFEELAKL